MLRTFLFNFDMVLFADKSDGWMSGEMSGQNANKNSIAWNPNTKNSTLNPKTPLLKVYNCNQ